MDGVAKGLDETALGSAENNNIATIEEGHTTHEGCGCVELARDESVGALATPLHRCKGRHNLPIIGEEMQGDQLARRKPDGKQEDEQRDPNALMDSALSLEKSKQSSDQTTSEKRSDQELDQANPDIPKPSC